LQDLGLIPGLSRPGKFNIPGLSRICKNHVIQYNSTRRGQVSTTAADTALGFYATTGKIPSIIPRSTSRIG